MRITAEARESTRQKILETAQAQFRSAGFEATTTRDIARAAGIATGTLFNYFPTKEAIVTCLVMEAQPRAARIADENHDSLEEALFSHAANALRLLKPYRKFLAPVLDNTLSPLVLSAGDDSGQSLRTAHLETVRHLALSFVADDLLTPLALQMYWTLYLGMLTFWISDKSPKQEDTLALLDQSIAMFVGWLQSGEKKAST